MRLHGHNDFKIGHSNTNRIRDKDFHGKILQFS